MAVVMITGAGARELLQHCFTKNLDRCVGKKLLPLSPGRCAYGAFLDKAGSVLDDAIVSMINETTYMTVVNAGMGNTITRHLADEARAASRAADIHDFTDRVGKIDLQGPRSADILASVLANPAILQEPLPFFSFRGHFDGHAPEADQVRLVNGAPVLLSRTGYTGEFGFELYMDPSRLGDSWDLIMNAGAPYGCLPCGLAARDSLRAGAVLPLSHQDIGNWPFINHPWEHALPFTEDRRGFTKRFIGDDALLAHQGTGYFTLPFAGFDLRKVQTGPQTIVVDSKDTVLGTVLTCVTDVSIDRVESQILSVNSPDKPQGFRPRGLCCGFVRLTSPLDEGSIITVKDTRRSLPAMIMKDIRPDRTARRPVREMLTSDDTHNHRVSNKSKH
jgi:aminomethyltransferase